MFLHPSALTFNLSDTTFKIKGWDNELICRGELCRFQMICLYVISHVYVGLICSGFILATLRMARISYERVGSGVSHYPDNISKRVIGWAQLCLLAIGVATFWLSGNCRLHSVLLQGSAFWRFFLTIIYCSSIRITSRVFQIVGFMALICMHLRQKGNWCLGQYLEWSLKIT